MKPTNQQGELGELDAQAGFSTQPTRAPAVAVDGDEPGGGENASRADGNGGRGGGSSSSAAAGGGAGSVVPPVGVVGGPGQGGEEGAAGREHGGDGNWGASPFVSDRKGNFTDVMAHELVVGCLVRLAIVVEGEMAQEVLSVLEHERGRARVRERLGRGAVGPMEDVVAKVGTGGGSMFFSACLFGDVHSLEAR